MPHNDLGYPHVVDYEYKLFKITQMNERETKLQERTQPTIAGEACVIGCLSLRVNFDYCMECQKITPYSDGYCFYCHSAAPLGDPCDVDIEQKEWDIYMSESILVGKTNEIDETTLSFLNSL